MSEIVHLRSENSKLLSINTNLKKRLDKYELEQNAIIKIKDHYKEIVDSIKNQDEILLQQKEAIKFLKEENDKLNETR